MNDAAKVQLSKEEMALVSDPEWILTKNSILERAVQLMAELSHRYGPELMGLRRIVEEGHVLPANWDRPKISRGENYQGLPYVVLDQPRLFGKDDILAIRTMFWWGHYFMVTLHLKGRMQEMFLDDLGRHAKELTAAGFHVATSGDEWRHELEGDNYRLLQTDSIDRDKTYPFIKLSAKCGLNRWNESPEILFGLFRTLVRALGG
ncbi:MAG TPA: hypothetical protein VHD83_05970 [Puia sp.]|nr:hypothetical protein [Puia sp.]